MNDATSIPLMDRTTGILSETIGKFVASFDFDKVPAEVIDRAKFNILDAIGIGFASVGYDFAQRLTSALLEIGGKGNQPVIGMDIRLTQRDAAHLNGTLIHGLDYDDTHLSLIHI